MIKFKVEGNQKSLDISFEGKTEDILVAFEKQVRPRREKPFRPSIALPRGDSEEGIDWDEVNRNALYPCFEAIKLPVGEERNAHCKTCPECKAKLEAMDKVALQDNKWLKPKKKKEEVIEWEIP